MKKNSVIRRYWDWVYNFRIGIHYKIWGLILIAILTGLPDLYKKYYDVGDYLCWIIISTTVFHAITDHYKDSPNYRKMIWASRTLVGLSYFGMFKILTGGFYIFNPAEYICFFVVMVLSIELKTIGTTIKTIIGLTKRKRNKE